MELSQVRKYTLPIRKSEYTAQNIANLAPILTGFQSMELFIDGADFFLKNTWNYVSVPIPTEPHLKMKHWRIRPGLQKYPPSYTQIATYSNGRVIHRSVKADGSGGVNELERFLAPGFLDPGTVWQWGLFGGGRWTNLMATHGGYFPDGVPALIKNGEYVSTEYQTTCNFLSDDSDNPADIMQLPLGSVLHNQEFPSNWFLAFDWDNKDAGIDKLVLVSMDDFVRLPPKSLTTTGGGGSTPENWVLTNPTSAGLLLRSLAGTTSDDTRLGQVAFDLIRQRK